MAKTAVFGISEVLGKLENLAHIEVPVARAMGVAMGQEVRDEAKVRAPVLDPADAGLDSQKAGQLRDAIYLAFDDRRSILTGGLTVYSVSWNAKKAPHGHLVEFGHVMIYEAAQNPEGLWYTPLTGKTRKVDGRKRSAGTPRVKGPLQVGPVPFLGPAFDAKLPVLMDVAATAGKVKFAELTNGNNQ